MSGIVHKVMGGVIVLTKDNSRNPGPGLRLRSLNIDDYDRGFLGLLGQLTSVGNISREAWSQR